MKIAIGLCLIAVSLAAALPADDEKVRPEVVRQDIVNNGDKGYKFDVETSDGSKRSETGAFKYVGGLTVKGSYEFVDEDGQTHKVVYEADEKGFRPTIVE